MKHTDLYSGMLRASLDGEVDSDEATEIAEHSEHCAECTAELQELKEQSERIRDSFDSLPRMPDAALASSEARVWTAMLHKRQDAGDAHASQWRGWKAWSLAGGALTAATLILILTVGPIRAWAENLLAVFRVEHFTVLELNAGTSNSLQNNQILNQAVGHVLSDEVTVTQAPQKPQPVADAAAANRLAGFQVKLLAGRTPKSLMLESGAGAQMKLDHDRLQSILNEAGRTDLRIPASVDGAIVGLRVPAGIMAQYGDCIGGSAHPTQPESPCITLMEVPSPVASMPAGVDPAQIAQVALEFFGMNSNDAASFTKTVDWTSTLVLPVIHGQSTYEQVDVHGNQGVLLRPKAPHSTEHFSLLWVDTGIVFVLNGTGDDSTALNLAAQLE